MTKRFAGALESAAVRGRFEAADDHLEHRFVDLGPASGRAVVRREHVAVLRLGAAPVRLGIGEVADDRMRAALGDAPRLLVVADERRHVVSGAHQRVEHGAADVSGGAAQEDPHRGRIS